MAKTKTLDIPPQHQEHQPGIEADMVPQPQARRAKKNRRLEGKVALITGGDSGIGRAVAIAFAQEGADIAISYLNEGVDADETRRLVEAEGRRCECFPGDIGNFEFCQHLVSDTVTKLGKLNVLVNNAAEQHPQESIERIAPEQLERTFRTNVFSFFYLTQCALEHLAEGSAIINTTSVTAYRGSPELLDYSSTKGAIVAFTRSLSQSLADRGIRVNAVAPGPIWTPLIPSTFSEEDVEDFGKDTPMKRAGQPEEIAPSYVFLASQDSTYMSGQVLHPNGGEIVNG